MHPPRLVLEEGGTSTLQTAMPGKLKSPALGTLKWGGTSLGGSRWPDQVYVYVPIISSFKIHGFPSNFQMVDIEYTNFPLPKICWSIKQPSLGIGSLKTANIFIFYFHVYECTYYVVI